MTDHLTQELNTLTTKHTPQLRAASAAERSAALGAARAAIEQAAERDRLRREAEAQEAADAVARALQGAEQVAEERRLVAARDVLAECFSDASDGLVALAHEWRREPGRALTGAIRTRWHELDARCAAALGEPIGSHVLTAIFVDELVREQPAAIAYLAGVDAGYPNSSLIEALGQWDRAPTAQDAQAALAAIEHALLTAAARPAVEITPWHREIVALRKAHATRRDYVRALGELAERQKAAELAAFGASYTPPSREPPLLTGVSARVAEWLSTP